MNISKQKLNRIINESINKLLKEDYDEQEIIQSYPSKEELLSRIDVESVADDIIYAFNNDDGTWERDYDGYADDFYTHIEYMDEENDVWLVCDVEMGADNYYYTDETGPFCECRRAWIESISDIYISDMEQNVDYEIESKNPIISKIKEIVNKTFKKIK